MMKNLMAALAAAVLWCAPVWADTRPDSHAPIGVMADHTHQRGEWMVSYRFMHMSMQGNLSGSRSISPEEIATTVANPFANPPMMPPTLRVVPLAMDMQMHMIGAMYAPTDRVTLMAMAQYLSKEMDHVTFAGPMGDTRLGTFRTRSSGLGDTRLSALVSLWSGRKASLHAEAGVSLPTGSNDLTDRALTPMNTEPTLRLPYPMQLGSGSYDAIAGLTYSHVGDRWGYGTQWRGLVRTADNDEDYRLGDEHRLTAWLSYSMSPRLSLSARASFFARGDVSGQDPLIMAPVQTADPDRQGTERTELGVGFNALMADSRHRLAFEVKVPVSQHLDGPQMETDWTATLGWQFSP